MLLHSCPDTVQRFPLRKTKTSTPLTRGSFTVKHPGQNITPALAACRYRAPLTPRLCGLVKFTWKPWFCQVFPPFSAVFPASGGPSPLPPVWRLALRFGDVVDDKGDGEHAQCPEQARHEGVQIAELVDALPARALCADVPRQLHHPEGVQAERAEAVLDPAAPMAKPPENAFRGLFSMDALTGPCGDAA